MQPHQLNASRMAVSTLPVPGCASGKALLMTVQRQAALPLPVCVQRMRISITSLHEQMTEQWRATLQVTGHADHTRLQAASLRPL
jgi:hypothetical protein